MSSTIMKPTKDQVRGYLADRAADAAPPPSTEEIRRRLGWHLVEAERAGREPAPQAQHKYT